jgi:hypothetical protein
MLVWWCLAGVVGIAHRRRGDALRCRSVPHRSHAVDDTSVSTEDDDDEDDYEEDELYRVLCSSDPSVIGYGSVGVLSGSSTLFSVETARASTCGSSSWTGDYFEKFDV